MGISTAIKTALKVALYDYLGDRESHVARAIARRILIDENKIIHKVKTKLF